MANSEHLAILKQGRFKWNEWRRQNPKVIPELQGAFLSGIRLRKVNLTKAHMEEADLSKCDLGQAKIRECALARANLVGADLREADLFGSNLREADLTHSLLDRVGLQNAECLKTVFRRGQLTGARFDRSDLTDADLRGADCRAATFDNAVVTSANLHSAILNHSSFIGCDLTNCDFGNADLRQSNLSNALLVACDLKTTDLSGSITHGTDFTESQVGGTHFGKLDLTTVRGLDTLKHGGPSSIAVDTLYASGATIPEIFLRGIGVPENLIVFLAALISQPIQFYSCFISYSARDQGFADRLHGDLQNRGVRCWFAPHDIKGGRKLHEQIDEAIRVYDRLLLILSEHSTNSEWVKTEIANARQREVREGRRMLFPISLVPFDAVREWKCFDTDTGKDSAREIREYFIPDFSNWKDHDSY